MSHLFEKIFNKQGSSSRDDLPLITITERENLSEKLPWIVKKTVTIYEDDKGSSRRYIPEEEPVKGGRGSILLEQYRMKYLREKGEPREEKPVFEEQGQDTASLNPSVTAEPLDIEEASNEEIQVREPAVDPENESRSLDEQDEEIEDIIDITDTIRTLEDEETQQVLDAIPHGETNARETAKPVQDVPATLFEEESTSLKEDDDTTENIVFDRIKINQEYIIPTSFLSNSVPIDPESQRAEIERNSKLLVNTLADFSIEARVVNVNRGPVVTLYEVQIASGIKVSKIVGLSDDIAMALAAYRVRIVAPIPGKSAIGVEIPNRDREDVTIGDILSCPEYNRYQALLKVALGKDVLGNPIMLDLKKLPHLLIAGSTGSGKSVCVNSIITSLVYNYDPNYVRFIMVDPKMVELQLYNGLPHLLTPVIIEPHAAPLALKWATYEMERRYRLLSGMNTRDIDRYNTKIRSSTNPPSEELPYIIIIIDELADLMMVAPKEIEGYITRIAQKARAVGIHLVLATQRPSVDVITGIIKANFPARIAFQVAQKTDSRTIIDQNGAEKLLGKGDMLYQSPVSSYPERIQGAFVSEEEILDIVSHLKSISEPNYIDLDASIFEAENELVLEDNGDELFNEAVKIIEETRKASASYLQRRLSIGYNRAARIIELMEERGYVGPQQGSKPRDVLI